MISVAELRRLANEGFSATEISKRLGFCQTYIRQVCRANNILTVNKRHVGFITTHNGYRMVRRPGHPDADSKGYVRLHRIVMEDHLGHPIPRDVFVHHVNGDKSDNRIENLCCMSVAEHVALHHTGKKGRGPDKKPRKKKTPPRS